MPTFNQLCRKTRINRTRYWKKRALDGCPQRRGTCTRVYTTTPKKPCSARRPIARVNLTSKYSIFCHFPGIEHPRTIRKFSVVLVRGGRPNDLPAVKYRAIRGARKTDFRPLYSRITSRSVFGVQNRDRKKRTRKIRISAY
jgi:small subunit ribosomal protein S12